MSKVKATKKVPATTKEEVKTTEKTVNAGQQKEMDKLPTISAKIRFLDKEQFTRVQITKITGKRYQHVRNVLETPLKRKAKSDKKA